MVGQAAECRPQTQNVFQCFSARKPGRFYEPLGQVLCLQYPGARNSVISTPGSRTLSSVPLGQKTVIRTPGPRTLSSVPLGQELCLQYSRAKNSVISTPGPRTLSSVPLGQELCHQYPWAKNSVISTPGPRTLSPVPLSQELCHQYPWARNSVSSTPEPRTVSSVPLGQELCHQPWIHPEGVPCVADYAYGELTRNMPFLYVWFVVNSGETSKGRIPGEQLWVGM